jgi:hypothetical protein
MSSIIRNSKFTILNEYRYSQSRNESLGTDYSSFYSFEKNINLHIYHKQLDSLITFKCFLESFEMGFDVKYDTKQSSEGEILGNPKDFSIIYKLKMQVPSPSVNDARVNDARFSELNRQMVGQFTVNVNSDVRTYHDQSKRVLMGNLIHNGGYNKRIKELKIAKKEDVEKYGLLCQFKNVNWEPDVEMGFFEYEENLWAKSYTFSLDLNVNLTTDSQLGTGKRSFSGFLRNGEYHGSDIQTWPFGV